MKSLTYSSEKQEHDFTNRKRAIGDAKVYIRDSTSFKFSFLGQGVRLYGIDLSGNL